MFAREFQHNSIKSVQCVPLDFFQRNYRRTSPFSNLFKIPLHFGTELLLFLNALFLNAFFFVLYFNL